MKKGNVNKFVHKYNIGDVVRFKDKYPAEASCDLHEHAGTTAKISGYAKFYECKPCYYLEGINDHVGDRVIKVVFPEDVFAGLVIE